MEHRRLLAVRRLLEGYSSTEVAAFLAVAPRSVRRWLERFRRDGESGLLVRPGTGRPAKLTTNQEKFIRRWLGEDPTTQRFATELWTGVRLADLIRREFDISLHPQYLCAWTRDRGFTPQKPQWVAREGDPEEVAAWLECQWPRIKNRPGAMAPTSR